MQYTSVVPRSCGAYSGIPISGGITIQTPLEKAVEMINSNGIKTYLHTRIYTFGHQDDLKHLWRPVYQRGFQDVNNPDIALIIVDFLPRHPESFPDIDISSVNDEIVIKSDDRAIYFTLNPIGCEELVPM